MLKKLKKQNPQEKSKKTTKKKLEFFQKNSHKMRKKIL